MQQPLLALLVLTVAVVPSSQASPLVTVPKGCVSWFDGCNTCTVAHGRPQACTLMACFRSSKPFCKKFLPPPPVTVPEGCVSWFDGCNTCTVAHGRPHACTKMACFRSSKPFCKKFQPPPAPVTVPRAPVTVPKGCVSWFDGCNTCTVANGRPQACTEMACFRSEEPFCKEFQPPPAPMTVPKAPVAVPEGCVSWFDGCNTCTVAHGRPHACTKMACFRSSEPFCKKFLHHHHHHHHHHPPAPVTVPKAPVTVPEGCVSWFDGCNTCTVAHGQPHACTEKFCFRSEEPFCKEFQRPSIPDGCKMWFDGCNMCSVAAGQLEACTEMACEVLEEPACKVFHELAFFA